MFLLPRRQIWTQQPQGAVDIDWSNPLTRGLTYATADGAGGADSSITSLGSVPKIADRWGKGDYFNGSSQKIAKNSLVGRSLDLTVCVLHKSTVLPPNGPTYSHVLASTTGASSADYYGWILMLGNVTGAPQFRVYQSAFGGQDADCDATGAINDGKPHLTIATAYGGPGGAMSLDVDGKTVASSTHPSGIYSRTNNLAIGKARHDFWGGFEGSIGAVFVFDRVLSAKERSSLSANPWQIFKRPDSRIFVPVSAGGGSVNANASGALSAVAVTAPSASASGGASSSKERNRIRRTCHNHDLFPYCNSICRRQRKRIWIICRAQYFAFHSNSNRNKERNRFRRVRGRQLISTNRNRIRHHGRRRSCYGSASTDHDQPCHSYCSRLGSCIRWLSVHRYYGANRLGKRRKWQRYRIWRMGCNFDNCAHCIRQ
jgi:hypothetical protein